jgi:hypothetical protein
LFCAADQPPPAAPRPAPPAADAASDRGPTAGSEAKPVKVTGVQRVNFPNGDSALVLNYETEIAIDDAAALREGVLQIWQRFRHDVEKAGVNGGVIRATYFEGTGLLRSGKGMGFVFARDAEGNWQLQESLPKQ